MAWGVGMNGEPSYSTKEAPTASADTNQFHIIQPVYRDDVNTLQSLTQKTFNLHIKIEHTLLHTILAAKN